MSSRKTTLALMLAFLIPSALLVSLQGDITNRIPPANRILFGYYSGTGPPEVVGTSQVPIVAARCLVRGVLRVCLWLGADDGPFDNVMIQLAAVWGALCMIYLAAARLMPPGRACAAVLLAVVFVPWGFVVVTYSISWPYDLPSLFFAAFGVWTILSRRFATFSVALVLGTLNKETVVFLLPAYLLAEWPLLPRKTWVLHALVLATLFLVTYEIPRMILAGNQLPVVTASAIEHDVSRWRMNIQHLVLEKRSTPLENVYWALSIHLLPLVRFSTLPRPLRAIYFAVPVLLVPIFFYGNIYEFRLYNEIIPLGAISTVFVVSRLLETPAVPAPPDDAPRSAESRPAVDPHPTAS